MNSLPKYMILVTIVIMIGLSLVLPSDCPALATFSSLGVDQNLRVQDPSVLQAAGLKDIRAGDTITVVKNTDRRGFTVTNVRTGKNIQYPPVRSSSTTRPAGAR